MNKFIYILISILTTATLFAQTDTSTIIYLEEFNTPDIGWNKLQGKDYYTKVRNGTYIIKSSIKQSLLAAGTQVFIDYRKNFSIETKIKFIQGKNNKGFGILWGSRGIDYSYMFLITNNQYYSVGIKAGKKFYTIKRWTKDKNIIPNNYNLLKIEKIGITLRFYINNKPVFTTQFLNFFGQFHGLVVQGGVTVQVDYFKITSEPRQILLAENIPFTAKRQRLSTNINTIYSEIAPIISPDGKTLWFGRIYDPRNIGEQKACDIWYSELQPDGTWGPAKHAPFPLNNEGVNAVITVTPDGNALILEGLYNDDGSFKSEQGISISYKTKNGWSIPKPIIIKNFYNKNIFETYCLSNDLSIIVMSIERDDTYGDLDLYVSFRNPDGTYTEPKNLGPIINTFASESTPFLAADNKTLYFSSNGHPGYGSHDIFVAKRLDDSWTYWTQPKNLGPLINTYDWDTYLSIPAKGDYAYFSSTFNSVGNEDIFRIKLDKSVQPEPVILVYGKVLDYETKKPIEAEIKWFDLQTGKQVGIARSHPVTGEYKLTLPFGKIYGIRAEAKNYIAQSDNLDLRNTQMKYEEIEKNLYLFPLKINQVIRLNNVFFEKGKPILMPESYEELNRLVKLMKDNPNMVIELHGHTDYRGNYEKLMLLSQQRVDTVKKYLVQHGIDPNRIKTKAFGPKYPVYRGPIEELHKLNRRVEFKILKF